MLSSVFITLYLFFVYYCESLDCNGRQLDYQKYTIQPIIICDIDTTKHANVVSFINDAGKLHLNEVPSVNGLRKIFEIEAAHAPGAIVISSSLTTEHYSIWASRLSQWGEEFYTQTVVPFVKKPPKVLKASIVTISSSTNASAILKDGEGNRESAATNNGMKVVRWPVVITDKGPLKNADLNLHDLALTYPHLSVITLNNAEAANEWKSKGNVATPPLATASPQVPAPAGLLRVFNIQDLSNIDNDVFGVPFLKEVLKEINYVLCASSTPLEEDKVKSAAASLGIYAGVGAVLVVLIAVPAAPYFMSRRFCCHGKVPAGLWVGEDGQWYTSTAEEESGEREAEEEEPSNVDGAARQRSTEWIYY